MQEQSFSVTSVRPVVSERYKETIMRGKCWKFGDHVDTDQIIPARYLNTINAAELAAHCMEDADASFAKKVKKGEIIVGGENFGCGSSREHAPLCIKAAGVSCVVAKSFARIFFRNAINIGLPILECPEAVDAIKEGDEIEVDLEKGSVKHLGSGKTFSTAPFPKELREIIAAGGLMSYVKNVTAK